MTHPRTFRDWEMRAFLDGRKTMFRLPVEPQPNDEWGALLSVGIGHPITVDRNGVQQPGDAIFAAWWEDGHVPIPHPIGSQIWCREAWQTLSDGRTIYRDDFKHPGIAASKWRSPQHMPEWASRLTLAVVDVKVERVQEISKADAMDEGCPFENPDMRSANTNPVKWYETYWNTRYGKRYPWHSNPGVWAFTVEVAK